MHAKKWAAFVLWVDLKTWYPFHPLVNHHFQPFSHMFAMNAIQWGSIPHFQIITPNHLLFPFLISHDICPVFVHVASHLYRDFTVLALKKNTKNTRWSGEGARVFQSPWATTALAVPFGDVQSWCSALHGLMTMDDDFFYWDVHDKKLLMIDNIERRGVWLVWHFKLRSHVLLKKITIIIFAPRLAIIDLCAYYLAVKPPADKHHPGPLGRFCSQT